MVVHTQRFGAIDIDPSSVIHVEEGLLGFPEARQYCLLETASDCALRWMQSTEHPELAFLVVNPYEFFEGYEVYLDDESASAMELERPEEAAVLALVALQEDKRVTANLVGPVVINTRTRQGRQVVLDSERYGTRHELQPGQLRACAESAA